MTVKTKLTQGLIAGAVAVAFAGAGVAIAQSTPPTMGDNPATASGQQSTQNTPMGTTGTPANGATLSNNNSGAYTGSTNDTTMQATPTERDAQADRN